MAIVHFDENDSTVLKEVTAEIIDLMKPEMIYLYNSKKNSGGQLTSFKLAIILETENKLEDERKAYRYIDSDVPFDLLLYTCEEWTELLEQPLSFASRIMSTGTKLYG